ncbi:hypothetical protein LguiA_032106 [Lonicera macranthoides]
MSGKQSKRTSFTSKVKDKPKFSINKHNNGTKVSKNDKRAITIWNLRLSTSSGFSAVRFLKRVRSTVTKAFRLVSITKRPSSRKVSSSSLVRAQSYAEPLDSHRAEAVEDCIEFLNNSSSSLQRSNSVGGNS